MTPKSLLRHKQAVSPVDHLTVGPLSRRARRPGRPRPRPPRARSARARSTTTCSPSAPRSRQGARRRHHPHRAALPLAGRRCCKQSLERYQSAREWVWVQEESQNMGAWTFVAPRLQELLGMPVPVRRPRRQRQPRHRLEAGPRPRAGRARRGRRSAPAVPHLVSAHADPISVPACQRRPGVQLTMPAVPITVPGVGESISEGILVALAQARRRRSSRPASRSSSSRPTRPRSVVPAAGSGVLQDRRPRRRDRRHRRDGRHASTRPTQPRPQAPPPRSTRRQPPRRQPARRRRRLHAAAGRAEHAPTSRRPLSPAVRRLVSRGGRRRRHRSPPPGRGGRSPRATCSAYLESPAPRATPRSPPPPPDARSRRRAGPPRAPAARPRNPPADERPAPADRPAPGRGPADRRDPDHLQRSRHVAGHRPSHPLQGTRSRRSTASALGFMSFFVKASIEALKAFPAVNARIDGNEIVYHNFYDIGVAVSTERGLMVPVLRDADQLSFAAIEKAIAEFADQGPRGHDRRRRPAGRHVHDHQRRHLRLAALDADLEPAPERASWACTRSRSGPSSSTTRS